MKFQPAPFLPDDPELEPDLEWMLQSGQIPADMLASELIRAHFQDAYHWLLLVLDDPELAAYASLEAILAAATGAYRFPGGISSRVWVFRQAAGLARRLLRERRRRSLWEGLTSLFGQPAPAGSLPETRLEAAVWLAIDQLPDTPRLAAVLSWGLELPPASVAQILERSEPEIARLLKLARRRILDSLGVFGLASSDLPDQELDLSLAQSLERRTAQLQTGPLDVEALIEAAAQEVNRQSGRQTSSVRLKEFAWLSAAVVLILGLFWVVNLLLPEPEPGSPAVQPARPTAQPTPALLNAAEPLMLDYHAQAGETLEEIGGLLNLPAEELERLRSLYPDGNFDFATPLQIELTVPGQLLAPTAVAPVAHRLASLAVDSSPDEIRTRMKLSSTLWKTLWLDSVTFDYGPDGYYGSPHLYRVQSWLSQPDLSLSVTWISSSDNTYASLKRDGLTYTSYQQGNIDVRRVDFSSPNQALTEDMVMPNRSQIFTRPGQMQVLGEDTVAGRTAIVVDWTAEERIFWPYRYRMWVDAQTGLVLRFQFFSGQEADTLLGEVIIARLDLDVNFPQPWLFTPWRLQDQFFASDYRGEQADASVLPDLGNYSPERTRILIEERIPPPPGFDPASSRLKFQYPQGLQPSTRASPVAVFAGQYYLGEIMLPDPWSVHCVRSPDGRKVAFSFNPYGGPQTGTGWFELQAPLEVKTANLDQRLGRFAFAPDSRHLAIFVKDQNDRQGSLFVIDTETAQERSLVSLDNAKSLAWSQDGRQIVLLAGNPDWSRVTAQMIDAESGEQLQMGDVISDLIWDDILRSPDWPLPGSPVIDWEVVFPSGDQGLSACIQPPS